MAKLIPPVVPQGTLANEAQPMIDIDDELVLRPWQPSDAGVVREAYGSPDIQRYHFRRHDSEADAAAWIENEIAGWSKERWASWAVVTRGDDVVIGRASVFLSLEDGHGEAAYWVLPHARGRGVATRACRTVTTWAHDLGLHRVQLEHSITNTASRGVALACGFVEEGIRRGANLHEDGWHDMVLYAHLASDD